jgi:hypothetical protein
MKNEAFQVGDAVYCKTTKRAGIIVQRWTTKINTTEMYDVLFEDGEITSRMPPHITHITVNRRDGVEQDD